MFRATGFILFMLGISFSIIIMPNAQDIRMADNICNAKIEVMGHTLEIGSVAQIAFNSQEKCAQIHFLRLGVDYAWIAMSIGTILFFIGVWAGLGAKGKKEILG